MFSGVLGLRVSPCHNVPIHVNCPRTTKQFYFRERYDRTTKQCYFRERYDLSHIFEWGGNLAKGTLEPFTPEFTCRCCHFLRYG